MIKRKIQQQTVWLQNKWSCTSSKNDKELLNFSDASVPKHLLRVVQSKGEWTHVHLPEPFQNLLQASKSQSTLSAPAVCCLCIVFNWNCGLSAVFKGHNCLYSQKMFFRGAILRWAIQSISVFWVWCQVSGHMEIFIVWKKKIQKTTFSCDINFFSINFFFWVLERCYVHVFPLFPISAT